METNAEMVTTEVVATPQPSVEKNSCRATFNMMNISENYTPEPDPVCSFDIQQATQFLKALSLNSSYDFRTFDDYKDRKLSHLVRTKRGKLHKHFETLAKLNDEGAGVFITINETDGKGIGVRNITRVRAIWVDLDSKNDLSELLSALPLDPTLIVESSEKKYHIYWVLKDELPLDEFTLIQKALIQMFTWAGSDTSVHDLPRVMRLPGFIHQKGEPFMSRIVYQGERQSADAIKDMALPYMNQPKAEGTTTNTAYQEESFFAKVNHIALSNPDKWVPTLFPEAKPYHDGYRVNSKSLGRNLEEDISIVSKGIQDFGEEDGKSAIDLVMQWQGMPLNQAAFWLCEQMNIKPTDLGWQDQHKVAHQFGDLTQPTPEYKAPAWTYKKQPEFYPVDQVKTDNTLVKYPLEVARETEFPAGSAMFVCFGAYSAAASMAYCTEYKDGSRLPLGIYTAVEQPPSTSKSRMLNTFLKPVTIGIEEINHEIHKANKKLTKDEIPEPKLTNVLSNTTAEGLEKQMNKNNSGRFIIASAEQGAANQILAVDSVGRTTDKDLILKGYNGEYHSSSRVTRAGFSGEVYGSVTLIAQQGMTKKILVASGGEGLAERFLFLSEPHLLGKRTFDAKPANPLLRTSYELLIQNLINDFEFLGRPRTIDDCHSLRFTDEAYALLRKHRITIEPMLADYVNRGQMLLASALGKCDIHTMKIAALMHIASHGVQEGIIDTPIEAETVEVALNIAMLQFKQLERILEREGETGEAAAREAVLRQFNTRSTRKMSELITALQKIKPFKDMQEPYQVAKQTVENMLKDSELMKDMSGNLSPV